MTEQRTRRSANFSVPDARYIAATVLVFAVLVIANYVPGGSRATESVLMLLGLWQAIMFVAWGLRPAWRRLSPTSPA